jgi:hypothetical protein
MMIIIIHTTLHQFLLSIIRHTHLNSDLQQNILPARIRKHFHPKCPFGCLKIPLYHTLMISTYKLCCGRNSDLLRVGRSGDRIPVEGRFTAPAQSVPEAHTVLCTTDTGSFYRQSGRDVMLITHSLLSLKKRRGWVCTSASALCLHSHIMV